MTDFDMAWEETMAVNMPTAVGAAGTTAFGAQSPVPVIHWLGEHHQVQRHLPQSRDSRL